MTLYKERLNRDFRNSEENNRILEAYDKIANPPLNEDATADAKKTLDAILGATKDDKDGDVHKMAQGMKKSYEKKQRLFERSSFLDLQNV